MAEYDSDLEGKDEQITIHSNNHQSSKKRPFQEIENDHNHYSSNNSKNKSAKFDYESNDDIDTFLNDSGSDSDQNTISVPKDNGITFEDNSDMTVQNVEFELKDMNELYYQELKDILSATEWNQKKLNVIQLTDIIINQQEIGGVLVCGNSVLGFITLLSFKKYFEHLSLAHVKRFLLNRCKQVTKKKKFETYLNGKYNIGLFFCERPINTPLELMPHIYESLCKDIEYATNKLKAKHLSDEEIELFKCDYILMVVRYRWTPLLNDKSEEKAEENEIETLLPHLVQNRKNMTLVYEHLEHDLFVKKAELQFDFERNDKVWNVLLLKMSDFNNIVQAMHQL